MATKKTTRKTKASQEAEQKIRELSYEQAKSINESIINPSQSNLINFIMRFAGSKDLENMIGILVAIQDNPLYIKQKDEFETLYKVGVIDGQRQMVQLFTELCTKALEGDIDYITSKVSKTIIR